MFCKNCGKALNDNQAICLNCGVKVGEGSSFCRNCGNAVSAGADVCLSCGASVKKGGAGLGSHNKVTMALVCFFLGGIGIHNFMMGETKKGVMKIVFSFLCGIGGILALIDFIRILTDSYEINTEKYF